MDVIDSSVWVSYFRVEEGNHSQAVKLIENLPRPALTDYILLEVSTVLLIRESRAIAQSALNLLVNNTDIYLLRLTETELFETFKRFSRQKTNFSFVDISLIVLKDSRNCAIHTFDKELLKAIK